MLWRDAEGDVLNSIEFVIGSMFSDLLHGSNSDDILVGLAGNDTLDGGLGNDWLRWRSWCTYIISQDDLPSEFADEGYDTVQSSVSFWLSSYIEALILTGSDAIDGAGTFEADLLIGNSNDNILEGSGGADTLDGGDGIDTAGYVNSTGVDVSLAIGLGLTGDAEGDVLINIENITGSWLSDTLEGNSGDNVLDGGGRCRHSLLHPCHSGRYGQHCHKSCTKHCRSGH